MKAICYETRGPAREVLQIRKDLPMPVPQAGEVLVEVAVSAVNPSDTKARQGTGPRPSPWPLVIPHQDGAGVVRAVGDGVDPARVGQRVWLHECQFGRPFGAGAEWIALPQRQAVPLPDGVSLAEGATLGIPALTAWLAMVRIGAGPGKRVLVHGAAGAVGFYAVQMAQLLGAQVLGVVSNPQQAQIVQSAGVRTATRGDTLAAQAGVYLRDTGGEGFDGIVDVDFAAHLPANLALIATGGCIASYASDSNLSPSLDARALMHQNLQLAFLLVYTMPVDIKQRGIAQLTAWMTDGALRFPPLHHYPFDAVVQAHEAVESRRHSGKVLLDIGAPAWAGA